ncbi:sugar nucleotidyltransferase [Haladaptatus sp. F3-133]|uniref:glucose-1-phosphate thymidylyltransferase n=1 Tax=Halorutilus salinus TaxID=2487751 RepID=A0A9Q4C2E4_9EURY|nr:sugar nucleotidyltransferase [Halorutilus salinus]MCX2818625.1 sugar nucleotidyltransferase [Halorutilus salinus]
MKGVILAGGRGTRLRPVTYVLNKHILPVYDKPMIFYPVETLLSGGIDEIMVISTPRDIGGYIQLLEEEYDANFSYRVQKEPGGIAHALSLAEEFVEDTAAVILGDNVILENLAEEFRSFEEEDSGAKIFLNEVDEPKRYGVAELNENGEIDSLIEKPSSPETNNAVIGLYLYRADVFERIRELEPSDRGEYEITDVNKGYLQDDDLEFARIEGEWFDVGTPEGLFKASQCVRKKRTN